MLEDFPLPEGTRILVTMISEDELKHWQDASQVVAKQIWDNQEDDVYAELLKK